MGPCPQSLLFIMDQDGISSGVSSRETFCTSPSACLLGPNSTSMVKRFTFGGAQRTGGSLQGNTKQRLCPALFLKQYLQLFVASLCAVVKIRLSLIPWMLRWELLRVAQHRWAFPNFLRCSRLFRVWMRCCSNFFPTVIRWRQVAAVCAKRCKVFRNPSVWIRCSRTHLSRESYRCDEDRLKQRRNCRVAYSLFAPYGREFTEGDFS